MVYEDGDSESRVPEEYIRVKGSVGGGEEEKRSKIKNVRLDGTYDVVYEDGDSESRVSEEYIRVKGSVGGGEEEKR
eukprot:scaffold11260_cov194-Ochromonas_danica.AAC.1